jgi:5-formyltetrahydrofolate cyclo-ligase
MHREKSAVAAAKLIIQHPLFQSSQHIACYSAFKDEFETRSLIEAIWHADKNCYLPVLADTKTLQFVRYRHDDELQLNQYSIPEPIHREYIITAEKLDIVLTPLVAFDRCGNRIGTGGGYYDRSFAFLFNKPEKSPYMLGVGYALQECEEIETDYWDIKLNGVLTESEFINF